MPEGTEARGFVLYVGLDELKAAADGTSLGDVVSQIKELVGRIAPSAETHAAVALAPEGAGGRDVEVVRLALQDPAALAKRRQVTEDDEPGARGGVVVDALLQPLGRHGASVRPGRPDAPGTGQVRRRAADGRR